MAVSHAVRRVLADASLTTGPGDVVEWDTLASFVSHYLWVPCGLDHVLSNVKLVDLNGALQRLRSVKCCVWLYIHIGSIEFLQSHKAGLEKRAHIHANKTLQVNEIQRKTEESYWRLKPNSITLANTELAPNMFGASSELVRSWFEAEIWPII